MDFDIRTAILGLALGNLVFGLMLQLFQFGPERPQRIPFLATGKLLQGVGWLLLYERGILPDWLSFTVGNSILLIGTVYDTWAMYHISQRTVSRARQVVSTVSIIVLCSLATPLSAAGRIVVTSFTVMILFAVGGYIMLRYSNGHSLLRRHVGWSMWLMAAVTSVRGTWAALAPEHFTLFAVNTIQLITFAALYYITLTNGFGMLLLAKQNADRELRESEVRFRLAFENANIGMCLVNTQGGFLRVNRKMSAMFGYSQAELERMNVNDITQPAYAEVSPRFIQQATTNSTIDHAEFEKEYIHKQGQSIWGQVSSSLVRSSEGEPQYFISHVVDITDRKQSEEALRASEARFRSYFELPLIGIAITSPEKGWLDANAKLCAMLGYTKAELMALTWAELTHPEDLAVDLAQFNRVMAGEIEGYDLEKRFMCKDGRTIFTHLAVQCVRHPDQSVHYVVALLEDITERKQTEAALQASEARYQDLYENAPDMYLSVEPETGRILQCNQTVERLTGFAKHDLLGRQVFELYHPACLETAKQIMNQFMQTGNVHDAELQIRCQDGSQISVSLNVSAVRDATGKIVQSRSSWRDITERKRLEAQLQQLAATDGLTGVVNRRRFMDLAADEIKRATRLSHPLALALLDLDHFKQINDTYGHATGDQALIALTSICQGSIREIDVLARFGGDEFVLLFPETTSAEAHAVMERVRLALIAQPVDVHGKLVALSISVGIAGLASAAKSLDTLIECADQALYQAKAAGRNRVVSEPTASTPRTTLAEA